jgi:superfamily I DNA/RNA helicase
VITHHTTEAIIIDKLELGRRKIPFVKYGGIRYLEAAHVKDFVARLRVAVNPGDQLVSAAAAARRCRPSEREATVEGAFASAVRSRPRRRARKRSG